MTQENLRDRIRRQQEQYKYEPFTGGSGDTPENLKVFAGGGFRVHVVSSASRSLQNELCWKKTTWEVFRDEIGFIDEEEAVNSVVKNIADNRGLKFVKGALPVLDNKGPGGQYRYYDWPFTGLRYKEQEVTAPEEVREELEQSLENIGVSTKRIASIETDPNVQSRKGATLAVFTGKVEE